MYTYAPWGNQEDFNIPVRLKGVRNNDLGDFT